MSGCPPTVDSSAIDEVNTAVSELTSEVADIKENGIIQEISTEFEDGQNRDTPHRNGYIKLPGNIILEWHYVDFVNGNDYIDVNTAFTIDRVYYCSASDVLYNESTTTESGNQNLIYSGYSTANGKNYVRFTLDSASYKILGASESTTYDGFLALIIYKAQD